VWHASVAPRAGAHYRPETLQALARRALDGVGNAALGEWDEWNGYAWHVRRRLTEAEALVVGPVVDVRGTLDGRRRCAAARRLVPAAFWSEECAEVDR